MRPVRPPGGALACSGMPTEWWQSRHRFSSSVGVYSMFPLHAYLPLRVTPGSDTAAWICSGGCGLGSLCASSALVGEGGHWTHL